MNRETYRQKIKAALQDRERLLAAEQALGNFAFATHEGQWAAMDLKLRIDALTASINRWERMLCVTLKGSDPEAAHVGESEDGGNAD